MKQLFLISLSAIIGLNAAMGQSFEGSVHFTRSTGKEVIKYAYHVKGDKVRIDEMEEGTGKLVGTMIVDLASERVFAISHERKMFLEKNKKEAGAAPEGLEVRKGELERVVKDKKCQQWRVKGSQHNTEINYWVTDGDYAFFPRLLKVLARKDNLATYYQALPEQGKHFPMLATEYSLLREERGFLQVDAIEAKKLDSKMFEIPASYVEVEK